MDDSRSPNPPECFCPDPAIPPLLNVAEVAKILGRKPKTLRNQLQRRNDSAPVPVKCSNGYNIRFERAAVLAWIARHSEHAAGGIADADATSTSSSGQ